MSAAGDADAGRRAYYGELYGVAGPEDERPPLVVLGNCQAEALRILLDADDAPYRGVRLPAVHELEADDLPFLRDLLGRSAYAVMQPVAKDYRGLPIGTEQLQALLPAHARVVRIPVLFYSGTLPWQALVRDPRDGANDPPVVPYHDLRTLAQAATGGTRREIAGIAEHAQTSAAELRAREEAHRTVRASDLLDPPSTGIFHTINHPGNGMLTALANRIRTELGLDGDIAAPDHILLSSIISPVEPSVAEALGIEPRGPHWVVDGRQVAAQEVVEAQLAWYGDNHPVVEAGIARHGDRMRRMGLM